MWYIFDNYDSYSVCDNPFGDDEEVFDSLETAKEYCREHGKRWTWGN